MKARHQYKSIYQRRDKRSQGHHKGHRPGHAHSRIYLLGNAEERAYTEKLRKHYIVDQYSRQNY